MPLSSDKIMTKTECLRNSIFNLFKNIPIKCILTLLDIIIVSKALLFELIATFKVVA